MKCWTGPMKCFGIAKIGRPWGTRIYPHAPRRAGGQAGFPEMGQYFQVDCKKSQLFKNFPLVLDDDETSLGQVTKLAPDAEEPESWLFRWSRSLMYLLARLGVVRRFEWSTVRQITSGSSSGMLAIRWLARPPW
ncbi:hypothetical protein TNCV_4969841 [Trichonephila clavipes]|nr:hypothetical protein TNCV_4969841 [Trichonephila clavipes]